MPLFHTAELNGIVTPLVIVGGTVVLLRAFEPAALLELIESGRITHVFGLPMMYRAILDHPDVAIRDLSSLRRALEVFDCEFCLGFGQIEMASLTTVFQPEHQLTHTGSVGTPAVRPGETLTEGEVMAAAREGLSGFKAPKAVIIEEDLPRTSTGKVQKNLLRDRYRDRFEPEP